MNQKFEDIEACFLYQDPHKCHRKWAESLDSDFIHFNNLKSYNGEFDVLLLERGSPLWTAF
ncbi:hypothetical protein C9439_03895 [archaeon SCG-AAA382B04]|nr:hypothetical protein C9439_03895 [archaeon SCG-AAA382B04]